MDVREADSVSGVRPVAREAASSTRPGLGGQAAHEPDERRLARGVGRAVRHRPLAAEEQLAGYAREAPLRRLVSPDDVAAAVVFLAGDGARSVTGEDLNVSAGIAAH